ncbi:hypothetical protein CSKR_104553 [Clonorchis sinensis]|uniref:Uncharacterized protein n=1 Tax=Clonorchis sinensis TaxID=79923 RepID=A0A3R7JH90_CLOSI|nr:hypothetical protein CSKR_104553 [Clonorchis sinensis]
MSLFVVAGDGPGGRKGTVKSRKGLVMGVPSNWVWQCRAIIALPYFGFWTALLGMAVTRHHFTDILRVLNSPVTEGIFAVIGLGCGVLRAAGYFGKLLIATACCNYTQSAISENEKHFLKALTDDKTSPWPVTGCTCVVMQADKDSQLGKLPTPAYFQLQPARCRAAATLIFRNGYRLITG